MTSRIMHLRQSKRVPTMIVLYLLDIVRSIEQEELRCHIYIFFIAALNAMDTIRYIRIILSLMIKGYH
jgi:hypothetical protein